MKLTHEPQTKMGDSMIRKFNVICQVDIPVEIDDSDITEDESIEDIAVNEAINELYMFNDVVANSVGEI